MQQERLETFYNRAINMLAEPASDAFPANPLFSVEDMPNLVVHFGPSSSLVLLRSRIPASCFLLGIHDDEEVPSVGGRTLFSRIGENDIVAEASILTSILPEKKVRLLDDPICREKYSDQFEEVQKSIAITVENDLSERRRGLIRLRAACHNLKKASLGKQVIPEKLPDGIPVVLCGAGPSLAEELDALKKLKEVAVIVAVGHAVRTLDQGGIVPDIVVEGDSLCGRNWPEGLKVESLLVATSEVAPEVAARFNDVLWCTGSSPPFNQAVNSLDLPLFQVRLNKTVSVHALDFILRIGGRKIALIGQDYCFGRDGRLYAEPSQKSVVADSLELPAAVGHGTVVADAGLQSLWKAINAYIDGISEVIELDLTNCSGGAALNRTTVSTLKEWADLLEKGEKPTRFYRTQPLLDTQIAVPQILAEELRRELASIDEVQKSCRGMRYEVERYPVRPNMLQRKKVQLESAIQRETATQQGLHCVPWIHTVFHVADQIMKETPGMVSNEPDAGKQLNYLSRRYALAGRFCQDLIDSLENNTPPNHFSAYREENLAAIARNNPALAERLRALIPAGVPDGFVIHWFNQILPNVYRAGKALCSGSRFFHEAREQVVQFAEQTGFNPATHALTIIAPGNWVYVLDFINCFPGLELVVIDPWPQVLAQQLEGGCFLHRLPESACVVDNWFDPIYIKRRNEWRSRGLKEVRYVSPRVADFPDVAMIRRNMELLP